MCATSLSWHHLVNAYGVKAWCGCLEPLSAACIVSLFARAKPRFRLYLACVTVQIYVALSCVSAVVMMHFVAVCLQFHKVDYQYYYYRAACMQTRSSDEYSACLSVRPSVRLSLCQTPDL